MITTYIVRGVDMVGWRPVHGAVLMSCMDGKWSIGVPILILGGIYGGAFTPTEAAGVAVFYSHILSLHRELTIKKVIDALRFTVLLTVY